MTSHGGTSSMPQARLVHLTRMLSGPLDPTTVEAVGPPMALRWRTRCSRCGATSKPSGLISTALSFAADHTLLCRLVAHERSCDAVTGWEAA